MKILRCAARGRLRAFLAGFLLAPAWAAAQTPAPTPPPPPPGPLTLQQCLGYALANQPLVRQARLDEGITEAGNRVALSAWLPQVNATAVGQHYFGLPFTVFPDPITGVATPRQLGGKKRDDVWPGWHAGDLQ